MLVKYYRLVLSGSFIIIYHNVCAAVVHGCSVFNGPSFFCVFRLGSLSKEHGTKTDTKKEEKEESAPDSNENEGKCCI